jgi:predicted peroxiredoxin
MRNTMLICVVLLLALTASLLAPAAALAQDEPAPRAIFINLTTGTGDLQQCSMALSLASKCLAAGRAVTVFLNVHAVELAVTNEDATMFNSDELIRDVVAGLVAGGAAVIVCPMCLANSDYTEADLLLGVQVAGGDNFFPPLDAGAAVFSY